MRACVTFGAFCHSTRARDIKDIAFISNLSIPLTLRANKVKGEGGRLKLLWIPRRLRNATRSC